MSNDVFPPTKYEKLEAKHAALEQAVKDALKQIDNNIVEFSQSGEHGWAGGVLYGMTLAANVIKQKTRL